MSGNGEQADERDEGQAPRPQDKQDESLPRHGRSGDGFDSVIPAMWEQERQRRQQS